MSFERKYWSEGESGRAPITGADMNRIESGIADSGGNETVRIDDIAGFGSRGLDIAKCETAPQVRGFIAATTTVNGIVDGISSSVSFTSAQGIHDGVLGIVRPKYNALVYRLEEQGALGTGANINDYLL